MSDSEEDDVHAVRLGADECDRLCRQFAEITQTDTAVAMMFLQRNMWNLEGAVETYFNQFYKGDDRPLSARLKEDTNNKAKKTAPSTSTASSSSSSNKRPASSSLTETKRVKILSWNTDGIDESEPRARATCAVNVILKEDADVVMLQEVTGETVDIFDDKLEAKYEINYGNFSCDQGYFTAMAIKRESVTIESSSYMPFGTSKMGRGLQVVDAKIHGIPATFITSHLESLKIYENQRIAQLRQLFSYARETDISRIVFAGGDLNMRESDLKQAGDVPKGFYDAWEAAGKRDVAKWTWDTSRNDNHLDDGILHAKYRPRCRFDRLYVRSADDVIVKPVYFELVGLERSSPLRRFPSDHWGILFHADLTPTTPTA